MSIIRSSRVLYRWLLPGSNQTYLKKSVHQVGYLTEINEQEVNYVYKNDHCRENDANPVSTTCGKKAKFLNVR
jgi:HipA-like protein